MTWFWVGVLVGSMLVPFGIALDRHHRARVPRNSRWIIRRVYIHVDELLGATKTENQIRASKRYQLIYPHGWKHSPLWLVPRKVRQDTANYLWPVPQLGTGTSALPSIERMAVYVQVEFKLPPTRRLRLGPNLYQLWNVQAVTLTWTSEANALGEGYPRNLGRKVAQALRLEGADHLDIDPDYDEGRIRYARKGPAPEVRVNVPHGVGADA